MFFSIPIRSIYSIYFLTGSYPDFLMNIFRNYGDKFTFVKALHGIDDNHY